MKATDVLRKKKGISIHFVIDIPDYKPSAAKAAKKKRDAGQMAEDFPDVPMVRLDTKPMAG